VFLQEHFGDLRNPPANQKDKPLSEAAEMLAVTRRVAATMFLQEHFCTLLFRNG
jgi:hypothetical protein